MSLGFPRCRYLARGSLVGMFQRLWSWYRGVLTCAVRSYATTIQTKFRYRDNWKLLGFQIEKYSNNAFFSSPWFPDGIFAPEVLVYRSKHPPVSNHWFTYNSWGWWKCQFYLQQKLRLSIQCRVQSTSLAMFLKFTVSGCAPVWSLSTSATFWMFVHLFHLVCFSCWDKKCFRMTTEVIHGCSSDGILRRNIFLFVLRLGDLGDMVMGLCGGQSQPGSQHDLQRPKGRERLRQHQTQHLQVRFWQHTR